VARRPGDGAADAQVEACFLLIPPRGSATSPAMATARIIEEQRKTTQSGRAQDGRWTLEYEREQPQRPDPLTGWAGSGDTRTQVRLKFDRKEEALAFAKRKGLTVHVVPAAPVSLKLQAYADNFR
jgi:hypothetical protein